MLFSLTCLQGPVRAVAKAALKKVSTTSPPTTTAAAATTDDDDHYTCWHVALPCYIPPYPSPS